MLRRDTTAERTHPPTSLRLNEARRRGDVPRSADLSAAIALLGALVVLAACGPALLSGLVEMMRTLLSGGQATGGATGATAATGAAACAHPAALYNTVVTAVRPVLGTLAVVAAGVVAAAVLACVIQTGLIVAADRVAPDASRLSPAAGMRRLASLRSVVRLAMAVLKVAGVAIVAWVAAGPAAREAMAAVQCPAWQLADHVGGVVFAIALRVLAVLVALGIVDLLYQRWQHRRDLRITRSEAKDDLREMEGDPAVRKTIRLVARKRAGAAALRGRSEPAGSYVPAETHPPAETLVPARGDADE